MKIQYVFLCALFLSLFTYANLHAQGTCPDGSFQWSDISTIFQNNGCNVANCHGGSAGGLNLTTFANFNTGGTKCSFEITSGTTLVDIIQVGGVVCANGTVSNAMNNNIANPMPAADIAAIQAWIDSGAFENCRGIPEDDGLCIPQSTIGTLNPPTETTICSDGSNAPTFAAPTVSLPDVEIAIEVNGILVDISNDGTFDTSILAIGDEVCYTAFSFDLLAINDLLNTANTLCGALDCDAVFGIPGVEMAISDLVNGINDGTPGLNDLNEALTFAGSFGSPIQSVQSAISTLNNLNETIGAFNLGPVCFATSNNVCLLVEECIMCPAVANVFPPQDICPDAGAVTFCVEFDMAVDVNTVLTVEGISVDGSAGGTQICVDVPFTAPFDPCNGAAIDFNATAICDGTDLLVAITWLSSQILPITDAACGGVAGCTDDTACNYNPSAVCDDPAAPCLPSPTCNTDPCAGDTEIIDPNDACACIVDQLQVLGCTNASACNFDMAANCDDGMCDLGNTACADPCDPPNPDDGCALTTDTFDAVTCTVTNEAPDPDDGCALTTDAFDAGNCAITNTPNCAAGETFDALNCLCTTDPVMGCTNACADNYNPDATTDDGSCMFPDPDDACDLTVDSYDDVNCVVINEAPDPDDGCDLTTDAFDAMTCMITNTPICPPGETFEALTCECIGGTPGCLDPCDPNYDPNATVNDPNLCAGYDTTCNIDCLSGDLTVWNAASCSCIVDVVTVLGCTDDTATNYDSAANCNDGSCIFGPCDDMIAGSVIAEETGCSAAGIEVTVYDSTGAIVGTVTTDANGDYALMGVFPCGDYTAELTANIPACYSNSGGTTGPIGFTVNGDGAADGANFIENPQVPTLSQWGLIILALLLMNFGALSIGFRKLAYEEIT